MRLWFGKQWIRFQEWSARCPPDLSIKCLLLGPELPAVVPDLPLDHKALDGRLRAGHAPAAGVPGAGRWRGVTYQVIRAVRDVTLARVKLSGEVGGSGGGACGGGCGCGCDCGCVVVVVVVVMMVLLIVVVVAVVQ